MAIEYRIDADGVATLTMDLPERPVNLLDPVLLGALEAALDRLAADDATGVILISGKKSWVVGADIDRAFDSDDPQEHFDNAQAVKALFRRLERLGRPVVAALNGSALGGGLELALACHFRIALDDDQIRLGFPEVGLGLMPGAGGVVRTGRLIGLQPALEWLTRNRRYTPRQALEGGMVHALAADTGELLALARDWIAANPDARAPWDAPGRYRIPGGGPSHPRIAPMLAVATAMLRKETRGNYPAPPAILAALVEGAQVDFATAQRIESRYFARLATGQVSRNMIAAFWTQLNQIRQGISRPSGIPPQRTRRVGVLGAGMMGHGIAHVTALAGMEVVMTDATSERAAAGVEKITALLDRRVGRNRMSVEERDALLGRLTATDDYGRLAGCDLIIEAVFEDRELKGRVTRQAEAVMAPDGVFATNTSTLPISGLARASARPERFVGLHFFSPVHRMQLVEIIVGERTSDETLAKVFDYALAIGKVPIVVNDSRGFYTSRVFSTWTAEALALLAEGQHPQVIEMAGLQAGMPVGPLALLDELSLSLVAAIRDQTAADLAVEGRRYDPHPGDVVVDRMLALGRAGRAAGGGFYDYADADKRLWPGLLDEFVDGQPPLEMREMIDRLLFVQALETVRCLDEGVVRSVADANLGSIFGWGFAPFHGGTLQFINATGPARFVARARELAARYGARFEPPASLVQMAARGDTFLA